MNLISKVPHLLVLIFFVTSLSGCVEKEIVDDINIISGLGFDMVENKDEIKGTVLYPTYSQNAEVTNVTISATSDISREIILEVQRKSQDPLVIGSIEVVLFHNDLVKEKGIFYLVDSLRRDPSVGSRLYLAIIEGKAEDILTMNLGQEGTGVYLSRLLKHNIEKRDIPITNLHRFTFQYYQEGLDPFLPIIKKVSDTDVKIAGIAFMKKDKLVYQIPHTKMYFFKLLADKYSKGTVPEKIDEDEASIRTIKSNRNFDVEKSNGKVSKVIINVQVDAIVLEYTGKKLEEKRKKELAKKLEEIIKKECSEQISTFQEHGIDPVGVGQVVKSRTYNFDEKEWEDQYPSIDIEVKPKVTILETGVVE